MLGPSLLLAALSAHCLLSAIKQRRAALVDAKDGDRERERGRGRVGETERGRVEEREEEEEGIGGRSPLQLF